MTLDEFLAHLAIEPKRQYSVKEVAGLLGMAPSTVHAWCQVGLCLDGSRVPICLEHFYKGRSPVILGQ
jgi:hypothetical protein